jgi:hypothetical protein
MSVGAAALPASAALRRAKESQESDAEVIECVTTPLGRAWVGPMPITVEIDAESNLIRTQLLGRLDPEEIARAADQLLRAPHLRAGLRLLTDHSRLEGAASSELVRSALLRLSRLADQLGSLTVAIVAPRDANFGMGRVAQALAEPTKVRIQVFRRLEDAEAWLGVPSGGPAAPAARAPRRA